MKHLVASFCLCALTAAAHAETNPLIGSFTHEFTRPKNESVWTVKKKGSAWQVHVHGAHQTLRATVMSVAERTAFWEQMWWPAEKAHDAQCLRIEEQSQALMCYVQGSARAGISALSTHRSNYFYFDPMGGLMEIRRKGT